MSQFKTVISGNNRIIGLFQILVITQSTFQRWFNMYV